MIKGTTPTIQLTVTNGGELDLTQTEKLYLTIRQGRRLITKTEGLEIDAKSIRFAFTQQEALSLQTGLADVQVNWIYNDAIDGSRRRAATQIKQIKITPQLLEEVI